MKYRFKAKENTKCVIKIHLILRRTISCLKILIMKQAKIILKTTLKIIHRIILEKETQLLKIQIKTNHLIVQKTQLIIQTIKQAMHQMTAIKMKAEIANNFIVKQN